MSSLSRRPRRPFLLGLAALPVVMLSDCEPGCDPPPESFVITEIGQSGPTAYDLTPSGRYLLSNNGGWVRADLQSGTDTPVPFATQISDDGSAVVVVDSGVIVRTEIASGTAVTRSLPVGWDPSALTSIDAAGRRTGVTAINGGFADEAAYVIDMTTGQSTNVDSTVPGAQQGDGSRNPVLSADGSVVAFDRFANGTGADATGVWVSVNGGQATLISAALVARSGAPCRTSPPTAVSCCSARP